MSEAGRLMSHYDAIVLGCGGVGSAAAYHLARRGARVLGIDRFDAGHDRGSSHGETRVIRQAYFEHPDYVPLLLRAYALWRELEAEAGVDLLHQVGLLQVGPPDGLVVRGVLDSAARHGLAVERLSQSESERRFPAFRVPDDCVGVFEPAAGYLRVERSVLAHVAAAKAHGAEFRFGLAASGWQADGSGVRVMTDDGPLLADRLIVAPGAWAPRLLHQVVGTLRVPLLSPGVHAGSAAGLEAGAKRTPDGTRSVPATFQIRRKHVYWFPAADDAYNQDRCPTYLFELPRGVFYGFPQIDALGVKVAEHSGGAVVDDPLDDPRNLDPADLARVEAFLAAHLPGVGRPMTGHSVCYYTMSADEHFLVDRLPPHDNVFFAAGLSGHGFKFTSVLGEALADLALSGTTALPIGFLSLNRLTAGGRASLG